jgi:hypothetical protein
MPTVAVVQLSTPRVRFLWRVYELANPKHCAERVVATSAYGALAEGSNRLQRPIDALAAEVMRGAKPEGAS